jgi:hypothetical protein
LGFKFPCYWRGFTSGEEEEEEEEKKKDFNAIVVA